MYPSRQCSGYHLMIVKKTLDSTWLKWRERVEWQVFLTRKTNLAAPPYIHEFESLQKYGLLLKRVLLMLEVKYLASRLRERRIVCILVLFRQGAVLCTPLCINQRCKAVFIMNKHLICSAGLPQPFCQDSKCLIRLRYSQMEKIAAEFALLLFTSSSFTWI